MKIVVKDKIQNQTYKH